MKEEKILGIRFEEKVKENRGVNWVQLWFYFITKLKFLLWELRLRKTKRETCKQKLRELHHAEGTETWEGLVYCRWPLAQKSIFTNTNKQFK